MLRALPRRDERQVARVLLHRHDEVEVGQHRRTNPQMCTLVDVTRGHLKDGSGKTGWGAKHGRKGSTRLEPGDGAWILWGRIADLRASETPIKAGFPHDLSPLTDNWRHAAATLPCKAPVV